MAKEFMTPEQGAERAGLYEDLEIARRLTLAVVATEGMDSAAYLAADAREAAILRRIQEIEGTTGKHWMAR